MPLAAGLAPIATDMQASAQATPTPSSQPLVEPLSKRELEVLRLVAQGLSNREIAEQLGLGVAGKRDSQEICFVPDGDRSFLFAGVGTEPGEIVNEAGRYSMRMWCRPAPTGIARRA